MQKKRFAWADGFRQITRVHLSTKIHIHSMRQDRNNRTNEHEKNKNKRLTSIGKDSKGEKAWGIYPCALLFIPSLTKQNIIMVILYCII